jgi:hypothetical protein
LIVVNEAQKITNQDDMERLTDRNGFGNVAALWKSRRSGFDGDGI